MNSRQRRVDRRQWKYRVRVIDNYEQYVEMWHWLSNRHGRKILDCGWRHDRWQYVDGVSDQITLEWHFKREQDLIEFVLRWA